MEVFSQNLLFVELGEFTFFLDGRLVACWLWKVYSKVQQETILPVALIKKFAVLRFILTDSSLLLPFHQRFSFHLHVLSIYLK